MNIVRIKYAPTSAKKKTTPSSTDGLSAGWNTADRPIAIGTQSATTTTFDPANHARSLCSGWIGRSSSPENRPSRMRHSQNGAPKTTLMFRTSVQTM